MTEEKQEEVILEGFDPRLVHIRDKKTGAIVEVRPYKLRVVDGESLYEVPAGSKNLWFYEQDKGGIAAGVWDDKTGKVVRGAKHANWEPPKTEDQKLAAEFAGMKSENEKLLRELAALKAEQSKAAQVAKPKPAPARVATPVAPKPVAAKPIDGSEYV